VSWLTRTGPASRPHWALVVLVVLAHGTALWSWSRPSLRVARAQFRSSGVIHARVVPASSFPDAALRVEGENLGVTAPQPPLIQAAEAPTSPSAALPHETTRTAGPESDERGFEEYLPRNRLSVAPEVLTNVDVQFPPGVTGIVDLTARITLFIDEKGTVRRLRFDSAGIPSAFATSVLDTFLNARFKPGEVDGVAVRSQVRLEVEFHAKRGK
jgi:periplasmic protein TonB